MEGRGVVEQRREMNKAWAQAAPVHAAIDITDASRVAGDNHVCLATLNVLDFTLEHRRRELWMLDREHASEPTAFLRSGYFNDFCTAE